MKGKFFSRASVCLALGLAIFLSSPAPAKQLRIGTTSTPSDIGLFLAERKGFFRQEGLDVTLFSIVDPAHMLEALRTGWIDAGGVNVSPAVFNAAARDRFRIVADKGSPGLPNNHFGLLVRAEHIVSGRFKTLADLKGMRIAVPPFTANNASARLNAILESAGLGWEDATAVEIGFGQYVGVFNRSEVDAAIATEPVSGFLVERGQARRIAEADRLYPGQQVGVLIYSASLISQNRTQGERLMRAYLRGVRMFNDALIAGRLDGPNAEEVAKILMEYTSLRSPDLLRRLTLLTSNVDGEPDLASLKRDLAFFKSRNWIENPRISAEDVIDRSFSNKAVRDLGRGGSLISSRKGWNDG